MNLKFTLEFITIGHNKISFSFCFITLGKTIKLPLISSVKKLGQNDILILLLKIVLRLVSLVDREAFKLSQPDYHFDKFKLHQRYFFLDNGYNWLSSFTFEHRKNWKCCLEMNFEFYIHHFSIFPRFQNKIGFSQSNLMALYIFSCTREIFKPADLCFFFCKSPFSSMMESFREMCRKESDDSKEIFQVYYRSVIV